MREHLYRGKEVTTGEMVFGNLLIREGEVSGEKQYFIVHPKRGVYRYEENKVYPETVGQYTGLTIRGLKAFEGDIVRKRWTGGLSIAQIIFNDGMFIIKWNEYEHNFVSITTFGDELEIIGNIHDNKSLLSEAKDIQPNLLET